MVDTFCVYIYIYVRGTFGVYFAPPGRAPFHRQKHRVQKLGTWIQSFNAIKVKDGNPCKNIQSMGNLIEYRNANRAQWFLSAQCSGGLVALSCTIVHLDSVNRFLSHGWF